MTPEEAIQEVTDRITGGLKVRMEIESDVMGRLVSSSLRKIRPYYYERRVLEMIPVLGSNDGKYLDRSAFSRPFEIMAQIYDSEMSFTTTGELEAHLAGLTYAPLGSAGDQPYVTAFYVENDILYDKFFGRVITYQILPDKVLLSGNIVGEKVAVLYYPEPQIMDDVTVGKAIEWILDYMTARVKEMLGRVRGKHRGGDLENEMDYADLLSEAITEKEALEAKLETFDLRIK